MKIRTRKPVVNRRKPRRVSPLKADPSRTQGIRRRFGAELRRRFARLKAKIVRLVVEQDAFGLTRQPFPFAINALVTNPEQLVLDCGGEGGKPGPCPEGGAKKDQKIGERQGEIADKMHAESTSILRRLKAGEIDHHQAWQEADALSDRMEAQVKRNFASKFAAFRDKLIAQHGPEKIKGKAWQDVKDWFRGHRDEAVAAVRDHKATMDHMVESHFKHDRLVNPAGGTAGEALTSSHVEQGRLRSRFEADQKKTLAPLLSKLLAGNMAANEDFSWRSDPDKVKAFELWLRQQIRADLTGMTDEQVWARFIREGFERGAGRAFDDTRRSEKVKAEGQEKLDFYEGTKDEFLRSAFAQPVAVEKVKLLAGRSFSELAGITEAMSTQMTRTLVDGLITGQGPREIARELTAKVDISRARAETVARTEIIRSHAEGQLQALEDMGVEEVGVMVEWSTAGDERVCRKCAAMGGVVLKIDEARGKIPAHPNCRCAFIPANVGESTTGQKRAKGSIDRAAKRADVDLDVAKERPESVLRERQKPPVSAPVSAPSSAPVEEPLKPMLPNTRVTPAAIQTVETIPGVKEVRPKEEGMHSIYTEDWKASEVADQLRKSGWDVVRVVDEYGIVKAFPLEERDKPDFAYHLVPRESLGAALEGGLLPGSVERSTKAISTTHGIGKVFLTSDPDQVEVWRKEFAAFGQPDLVALKVDLRKLRAKAYKDNAAVADPGSFYLIDKTIPPEAISEWR